MTAAPLSTRERAAALAGAAAHFPFLGRVTEHDLLALLTQELGDPEALDYFVSLPPAAATTSHASRLLSRAIPRSPLLHVVSGNTPHAALQSLMRGLLLGAHNRCKLPSSAEVPEVARFLALLPPPLAALVETERTLPEHWLTEAEAIIVFGSDETIAHFHRQLRPDQRFVAHGHKVSLGVILDDPDFASVPGFARDVALYDQQGCLSPHTLYVAGPSARQYAERLAVAMQTEEERAPRGPLPLEAQGAIAALRDEVRFRATLSPDIGLWESPGSTAWTVILDPSPGFRASPLFRTIIVKPLPPGVSPAQTLSQELAAVRPHLSTVALHPFSPEVAAEIALATGAPRLCSIGSMQFPSPLWHHDGDPVLQPLVKWVDLDAGQSPT